MRDQLTVYVHTGRVLREFVIATKGSDILVPSKDSLLWGLIKQHLTVWEHRSTTPKDPDECIQIAVRSSNGLVSYSARSRKQECYRSQYRCYLTCKGERIIQRYLKKEFKKTFRDYMKGCLSNNPDITIVEAIEEFLTDFNVTPDRIITVESLRKDWYRYSMKVAGDDRMSLEM